MRIATHCTEADIAIQHIGLSRELGMDVHGDLMMPHMTTPETIARQGRIMVDAGATGVHIMDSAGALTMDDVKARIAAMLAEFGGEAEAGIHAHQNLSLAVANTMVAFAEGATLADACLAGAGPAPGTASWRRWWRSWRRRAWAPASTCGRWRTSPTRSCGRS